MIQTVYCYLRSEHKTDTQICTEKHEVPLTAHQDARNKAGTSPFETGREEESYEERRKFQAARNPRLAYYVQRFSEAQESPPVAEQIGSKRDADCHGGC